jgi:pyruvate dehydrogenase E2 component (dihydrolipoamide acetyltransferase)
MAEIVRMPKLSDTMTEGQVAEWHKKVGDVVEAGELLAEIETDKATMEFESFQDGVLLHIGVNKGETAVVDSILAILGEKGEDVSELIANDTIPTSAPAKEEAPAPSAPTAKVEAPVVTPEPVKSNNTSGRVFASPLAKKLAEEKGVDVASIPGTGGNGRVVKKDVEGFTPSASSANLGVSESYRDENISQMRKTIARRLSESKFSAPHFYLNIDVDMDNAFATRESLKKKSDAKFSFNDLVVKASAAALKKHPEINVSWLGDKIRYYDYVNIGVAIAIPEGLVVPVVKHADKKGLTEIGAEVREFAAKAKDKKIQPSDMEGNTFTISNLGMFGIDSFTAIVNPPDACILAVGAIRDEVVVKDGNIQPGKRMKITLSCDHRVVDGAKGSAFLQTLKNHLEEPLSILL